MKLPNSHNAIIDEKKIKDYLLNINHRRGSTKAKLFYLFGYSRERWHKLIDDIRTYHLDKDVTIITNTMYGVRCHIRADIKTPVGRFLTVRSVWQIDKGSETPRLITLIPD